MKIKHFLLSSAVLCPIAFILRLVQYFTVIDTSGYFLLGGTLQNIISWSVYGILALTVILSLTTVFSKQKTIVVFDDAVGGKTIGIMFIVSAILTMLTSGIFFTSASYEFTFPIKVEQIPNLVTVITAVFGILCALHFAFLGMSLLSGNKWAAARTLSVFSPVYFAIYGIYVFYTTFDSAGQSGTKIFMLSVCVIALFLVSLALAHTGSEVYTTRIAALSGILTVATSVTGPANAVAMLLGKTPFDTVYFVQAILHTALMIVAFCVLTRISFIQPKADDDEIEPIEFSPLDKFLNEIPDEDRGNDE